MSLVLCTSVHKICFGSKTRALGGALFSSEVDRDFQSKFGSDAESDYATHLPQRCGQVYYSYNKTLSGELCGLPSKLSNSLSEQRKGTGLGFCVGYRVWLEWRLLCLDKRLHCLNSVLCQRREILIFLVTFLDAGQKEKVE
jgi:hypothetical protein